MKYIAVFLASCILFLSPVSGMGNNLHHRVSASCCKENTKKDCFKQPKHASDKDCPKGNCNAVLSRGTCGFTENPSVSLSPAVTDLSYQLIHTFITGELSDYQDSGWNPPKA